MCKRSKLKPFPQCARAFVKVMMNLYSLAVAKLTVSGGHDEAKITPVGEEDMEWMKENLRVEQMNAVIDSLGTEEVR